MKRALAYIETIKELKPIQDADKIECATILGWELVVKKDEFKVGDLAVYCEIDSVLPEVPVFEFLRPKKFRIKTIKIRKQISQGIAFPLSIVKEVNPSFDIDKARIGDDLTEILGISKYELDNDIEEELQEKRSWIESYYGWLKWKIFRIKPVKTGSFPSYVPKTDETRVQKMGGLLFDKEGTACYIAEKCEGSSCTYIYRKLNGNWLSGLFGNKYCFLACSRNQIIYNSNKSPNKTHPICQIMTKYDLERKLIKLNKNIAIQGEIFGPKIQGNVYGLPEYQMRVFSIYDIDEKKYVDYESLWAITSELELNMVPVIQTNVPLINDIKYYVGLSNDKSKINSNILREGIVIRAMDSSFSFKSINPEYLLSQESKISKQQQQEEKPATFPRETVVNMSDEIRKGITLRRGLPTGGKRST